MSKLWVSNKRWKKLIVLTHNEDKWIKDPQIVPHKKPIRGIAAPMVSFFPTRPPSSLCFYISLVDFFLMLNFRICLLCKIRNPIVPEKRRAIYLTRSLCCQPLMTQPLVTPVLHFHLFYFTVPPPPPPILSCGKDLKAEQDSVWNRGLS